jgi:NSS family neurotransmitter:Na+ symporter
MFTSGNGLHLLDIFDHFIANFGLVIIGLVECILFGWFFSIRKIREHANETSDIKIGRWWDVLIKYIIPIVLGIILILSIIENVTKPYMNYSWEILIAFGLIPIVILFIFSIILAKKKGNEEVS